MPTSLANVTALFENCFSLELGLAKRQGYESYDVLLKAIRAYLQATHGEHSDRIAALEARLGTHTPVSTPQDEERELCNRALEKNILDGIFQTHKLEDVQRELCNRLEELLACDTLASPFVRREPIEAFIRTMVQMIYGVINTEKERKL